MSNGCCWFSPEMSTATAVPSLKVPAMLTVGPLAAVVVTKAYSVQISVVVVTTVPAVSEALTGVKAPVSALAATLERLGPAEA